MTEPALVNVLAVTVRLALFVREKLLPEATLSRPVKALVFEPMVE